MELEELQKLQSVKRKQLFEDNFGKWNVTFANCAIGHSDQNDFCTIIEEYIEILEMFAIIVIKIMDQKLK